MLLGEICFTQVVTRWRVYNFSSDLHGDSKNFGVLFIGTITIFANLDQISEYALYFFTFSFFMNECDYKMTLSWPSLIIARFID